MKTKLLITALLATLAGCVSASRLDELGARIDTLTLEARADTLALAVLKDRVDVIDAAQDDWHAVRIPAGVAVVHSGDDVHLAGHNHLDPMLHFYCPGCGPLVEGSAYAYRVAAQQQRQAQAAPVGSQ